MFTQFALMESRYYDRNDMFDRMRDGGSWSYAVEMGITVFLVLLFITLGYVLISRWMDQKSTANQTPIEIAEARFAKGEITKEELQDIKKELKA